MDHDDSFGWLEKNAYLDIAKSKVKLFSKIMKQTLKPSDEDILVIGDIGSTNFRLSPRLSAYYYLASEKMGLDSKILLQTPKKKGDSTNPEIVKALAYNKSENIIIANLSNKFGSLADLGSSFRKYCKMQGHKFVSTTSLGFIPNDMEETLIDAIDINYKKLAKKHAKLKEILDEGETVRVTTEAGTDLRIGIKGVEAISADGLYNRPGRGGNLPSGEVYIPPAKKQVWGKVVIDGSSRNIENTEIVNNPFMMTVDDGNIKKVEVTGNAARKLIQSLKWAKENSRYSWGVRRLGELGIGLNPKAKLIGSTILDEKVLGTAHVAIGSNNWMGGTVYSIIHLDQVFKKPIIEVDGTEIKIDKI